MVTFLGEGEIGQSRLPTPMVSVIIPCYNHGQYLDEAVHSVLEQTYQDFEIIVIDDGSTNEKTLEILETYDRPKTRLIRMSHQGLAKARNNGITACTGKYILPLDADDKIGCTYLEKAVGVLEANERVGIVYCKAEFFGEASGKWELPAYQFPSILHGNVIFCSAFFRKSDWAKVNGYNPNMIYGWEDYDFWLSLIELGRDVFSIPETLFYYRKRSDSMVTMMTCEQVMYSYAQLFRNHPRLYADNMSALLVNHHDLAELVHVQDQLIKDRDQLIEDRDQLIKDRDQLMIDLQSSLSWRMTKPLRYAKAVYRKCLIGRK